MNDRFKFRVYVTENDAYPEKVGYVNTEDFYIHPDGEKIRDLTREEQLQWLKQQKEREK